MSLNAAFVKRYIPIVVIVLAAIGMYGILPQLDSFASSLDAMRQATPSLLVAAVGANIVAYVCATGIYMSLALKPLRFGSTMLVQLSGLLINRVLPAGIGGLGLNFLYLRARKHTIVQSGAVAALNNGIGLVGHLLLLLILSVFGAANIAGVQISSSQVRIGLIVLLVVLVVVAVMGRFWRPTVRKLRKQLLAVVRLYRRYPSKLVVALLFSCSLTLASVLSLWLCAQALGIELSFYAVFLVYSAGVAAGTAIPTPGGLGGLEAAIVAGMITQNVDAALALAAVLLYRLLSFWLGLVIGAVATIFVQRQHLLTAVR